MAEGSVNSALVRRLHAASGLLLEALYFASSSWKVGMVDVSNGGSMEKKERLFDA